MEEENRIARVLLVDSDQETVQLLKATAEQSGYEVSSLPRLDVKEETIFLLNCIGYDLVAIAAKLAFIEPGLVPNLRRTLDCPVIVYEGNREGDEHTRALGVWNAWLDYKKFFDKFVKGS
jgi:DNA-binding response OmpR family regulator